MKIDILLVPYDTGHRNQRMGNGPLHLARNGMVETLEKLGHKVRVRTLETQETFPAEVMTAFDLYRQLADEVRKTCDAGRLPLVLSGNCGAATGTVSGMPPQPVGIIWLDAHGDYNTPETTPSGYLDGMGLATASGMCWRKLTGSIPHFRPVPANQIVHVGGRSFDPEEALLMDETGVQMVTAADIAENGMRAALEPALETLGDRVKTVYLHLDLDVLDPVDTPANLFPAPGGLSVETVTEAILLVRERFTIGAMGVASYDPSIDPRQKTMQAARSLVAVAFNKRRRKKMPVFPVP